MFKVLVLTGTGGFDQLVETIDTFAKDNLYEFHFQIGLGTYIPKNDQYVTMLDNVVSYASGFDYIISHAGVGIVFELLTNGISPIVVPNVQRTDHHQLELAEFLKSNSITEVVFDLALLESCLVNSFDKGGLGNQVSNLQAHKFNKKLALGFIY